MENGDGIGSFTYSAGLVLGFLAVVLLGLLGLPMTTVILGVFAAAVAGAFLYGIRSPA